MFLVPAALFVDFDFHRLGAQKLLPRFLRDACFKMRAGSGWGREKPARR